MFYCQHQNCFHCYYRCPIYTKKLLMKWSCKTAYETSVKKVSLNLSYQIHQWQITAFYVPSPYWISISSGIVIRIGLSFWTCNQKLILVFTYFGFRRFALGTFGKPTFSIIFWFPFFTKNFFIKLKMSFFLSNPFWSDFVP